MSTIIEDDSKSIQSSVDIFTPEPASLYAMLKLPLAVRLAWLKVTGIEVETIIENETFDLDAIPRKDELAIPIQVVFKAKIDSAGELDKLKARVVVRGDIQQKYGVLSNLITWIATAGFKMLRRFLAEAEKRGKRVKQLDFIAAFCQGKMQGRLFISFPSI